MDQHHCLYCGLPANHVIRRVSHENQTDILVSVEDDLPEFEKPVNRSVDSVEFVCYYCGMIWDMEDLVKIFGAKKATNILISFTLKDLGVSGL